MTIPFTHPSKIVAGDYKVMVGGSSRELPLTGMVHLDATALAPLSAE